MTWGSQNGYSVATCTPIHAVIRPQTIYIGNFATEEEAAQAYSRARSDLLQQQQQQQHEEEEASAYGEGGDSQV
jgi:hypothetical protein